MSIHTYYFSVPCRVSASVGFFMDHWYGASCYKYLAQAIREVAAENPWVYPAGGSEFQGIGKLSGPILSRNPFRMDRMEAWYDMAPSHEILPQAQVAAYERFVEKVVIELSNRGLDKVLFLHFVVRVKRTSRAYMCTAQI